MSEWNEAIEAAAKDEAYATPREYVMIFLVVGLVASGLGAGWWLAILCGLAGSLGCLCIDWIYDQRR